MTRPATTDAAALRGEALRAARLRLGLSQEQLARRLDVSFATVNRWEGGRTRPSAPMAKALAAVFALSSSDATGIGVLGLDVGELDRRGLEPAAPNLDQIRPDDAALLHSLATFPSSFSLDAAEAVVGPEIGGQDAVLLRLGELATRSMIEVSSGPAGPRYALPLWLQDAARSLPRPDIARAAAERRLSDWCVGFVRRAERGMAGREQDHWLRVAALEAAVVADAIERAVATDDAARAVELAAGFWRYWYSVSDLLTGRRILATALTARGERGPASFRSRALHGAGVIARQVGDLDAAIGYFHENLAAARMSGDDRAIAQAHNSLAGALHQSGNVGRARQLLLASLDWWERTRDREGMAAAISNLGVVASDDGDLEAAREFGEQALALRLGIGNSEGIAISYENLATVALRAGATGDARRFFREALRRYAALDELDGMASALDGLVLVLPDDLAARLIPLADQLRSRIQVVRSDEVANLFAARAAALRRRTRPDPGAELTLEVGVELALAGSDPDDPAALLLRKRLTPREREILALVTAGWTAKEIASRLGRSVRTVEHHLASMYAKVGARGRADAIALGVRMGLLEPSAAPRS